MVTSINPLSPYGIPSSVLPSIYANRSNSLANESKIEKLESLKDQNAELWELGVQQKYIESQKAAINSYMLSATGEDLEYDDETTLSLTDAYMSMLKFEKNNHPFFSIQPIKEEDDIVDESATLTMQKRLVAQYGNIADNGSASFFHILA